MAIIKWCALGVMTVVLSACVGIPDNITPVADFEKSRYLGRWFEVARLDHSFESGLEQVTAEYSVRDDGGLKVINRGYLKDEDQWQEAEGKAYFVGAEDIAHLKVSFFGPFYGSYIVYELDKDHYQYAFVTSSDKSYLWLLSRSPVIAPALKQRFVEQAKQLGFNTDDLIFVAQ